MNFSLSHYKLKKKKHSSNPKKNAKLFPVVAVFKISQILFLVETNFQ